MPRRKGFTLIELLVVIAIIAIIAAILFPVFMTAKTASTKTKCLNNAKQICGGLMLYEGDYGGTMLQGFSAPPPGISLAIWGTWYDRVNLYIRQMARSGTTANPIYDLRGVWLCPSMVRSNMKSDGSEIPSDLKRCYGYNTYYLGGAAIPNTNPTKYDVHHSSEVAKGTRTIRILEMWGWHHRDLATQGWGTAYCYPPIVVNSTATTVFSPCKPSQAWPPGWHSGRSTVGWVDGHVSTVKVAAVDSPEATAYTGIMQQYTGGTRVAVPSDPDGDNRNPYFRISNPKP